MIYDFSKIPSRELIEPGIYTAKIVKVTSGETRNGDPQKRVDFELENGKTISDFILEVESVYWKIQQLLYACELKCEGKVRMSDNWGELLGKELQIRIADDEYNGVKRSRVVGYFRPKQLEEEPEK